MSAGQHERTSRKGDGTLVKVSVPCEYWRCKNTSGKCNHREPMKVVEKGTGKLFGHLKLCNPARHEQISICAPFARPRPTRFPYL